MKPHISKGVEEPPTHCLHQDLLCQVVHIHLAEMAPLWMSGIVFDSLYTFVNHNNIRYVFHHYLYDSTLMVGWIETEAH